MYLNIYCVRKPAITSIMILVSPPILLYVLLTQPWKSLISCIRCNYVYTHTIMSTGRWLEAGLRKICLLVVQL